MTEFEIIKMARDLVAKVPESTASDATLKTYAALTKRLVSGGKSPEATLQAAMDTTKTRTWYSRRAALKWTSRSMLVRMLASQDSIQRLLRTAPQTDPRWEDWRDLVKHLGRWARLLDLVEAAPALPPEQVEKKHSKRSDLRKMPKGWRVELVKRLPRYRLQVLTQGATGCRPSELEAGVQLRIEGDMLVARIEGSKVTGEAGQPWRELEWPVTSQGELVRELVLEVLAGGGSCTVKVEDGRRYSGAIRAAGKRAFKNVPDLSAYTLRHAAASDMKAAGLPSEQISAALGHQSDVTKSMYGHHGMGSKGGVSPVRVTAALPVKRLANKPRKASKPAPAPGGPSGPGMS